MKWETENKGLGEVEIEKWWDEMEMKILEAIVYKDANQEPVIATSIAPWIPPSCRANKIFNTEHLKSSRSLLATTSTQDPVGCPKKLADLIRNGTYNPLDLHMASAEELRCICSQVDITQ